MSATWSIPNWAEVTNLGTCVGANDEPAAIFYDREAPNPVVHLQRIDEKVDGVQVAGRLEIFIATHDGEEVVTISPASGEELLAIAAELAQIGCAWDSYAAEGVAS